jgi:hypothetical protein
VLIGGGSASDDFTGGRPAQGPSLFPAPDQFLYVRMRGESQDCVKDGRWKCKLEKGTSEKWVSETKPGRALPQPFLDAPMKIKPAKLAIGNHEFTHDELAKYDPTPRELLSMVERERGPVERDNPMKPFWEITGALMEQPMPPNARRALIGALPLIPGTKSGGEVRDSRGRRGVLYSRVHQGQRDEVIVDPRNFVLLESRAVKAAPGKEDDGLEVGDVLARMVFLERAVVSCASCRP